MYEISEDSVRKPHNPDHLRDCLNRKKTERKFRWVLLLPDIARFREDTGFYYCPYRYKQCQDFIWMDG